MAESRSLPSPVVSLGKLAAALVLMGGLVWYLEPARLWAGLAVLGPEDLLPALVLGAAGMVVQAAKWLLLLRRFRPATRWGEAWRSLLAGFGLGLLSPGRLGELGRGVVLDGDQQTWLGLAVIDRLSSAVLTLALGWLGLVGLYPGLGLLVLAGLVGLVGLAAAAGFWMRLVRWRWWQPVAALLPQLDRRAWGQIVLWSAAFNLVFCGQFLLLLGSWGQLPAGAVLAVPVFFAGKMLLPVSILDIGVREAVAVMVFSPLGMDPAVAFNAAFILFVLNVVAPGVGGWFLLWGRFSRRLDNTRPQQGFALSTLETRR